MTKVVIAFWLLFGALFQIWGRGNEGLGERGPSKDMYDQASARFFVEGGGPRPPLCFAKGGPLDSKGGPSVSKSAQNEYFHVLGGPKNYGNPNNSIYLYRII